MPGSWKGGRGQHGGPAAEADVMERVDLRIKVEDLELMPVLCASVKPKNASKMIEVLAKNLPIPELRYLKRMRKRQDEASSVEGKTEPELVVIIAPPDVFSRLESGTQEMIKQYCDSMFEEQTDPMSSWPLNYRPPAGGMKVLLGFSVEEIQKMKSYMRRATSLAVESVKAGNGAAAAVIVDPTTGEVQGEGVDLAMSGPLCSPEISEKSRSSSNDGAVKRRHPLHHAAMCAIQKVAALQRESQFGNVSCKRKMALMQQGDASKEESALTGARNAPPPALPTPSELQKETVNEGPYLCTGDEEAIPSVLTGAGRCAMALVHSRLRRVIYAVENQRCGALSSRWSLHTQKSLNHHYEVYKGLLADEVNDSIVRACGRDST